MFITDIMLRECVELCKDLQERNVGLQLKKLNDLVKER